MRRTLTICAIFLAPTLAARADEKSHKAAAEALLKAAGTEATLAAAVEQSIDVQVKANPSLSEHRATMKKFLNKHLSWDALKEEMIKIYAAEFTEEELQEITKFYETPVGKKMVAKLPKLTAAGMQLGMKRVQENQGELIKMLQESRKEP